MPLLADLANAIRMDEPRNLFCLVEFGDGGIIVGCSSGKGWEPGGENYRRVKEQARGRILFFNDRSGVSMDGEERMVSVFEDFYTNIGYGARHITIFTAASPCSRTCGPALHALAERWRGTIKTWTIAYHQPYKKAADMQFGGLDETLRLLNDDAIEDVQMKCFVLHGGFVDERTVHGR